MASDLDKQQLSADVYRIVRGLTFLDDTIRLVGNVESPTLLQEAADLIRLQECVIMEYRRGECNAD